MRDMFSADEKPIFEAFREAGVSDSKAFDATRRVRELTGHNIVSYLENLKDGLDAKIDSLRWMVGILLVLMALLTAMGIVRIVLDL